MRDVPIPIQTELTASAPQPGYLVRIDLPAPDGSQYLCTFDRDFVYNEIVWRTSDIQISGINWISASPRNGQIVFGDADAMWWRIAAGGAGDSPKLQDAPVVIWQAYMGAPDDVVALWRGRIGGVAKRGMMLECVLTMEIATTTSPRRRVQSVIPAKYLVPPGKKVPIGNQVWTLLRKVNAKA